MKKKLTILVASILIICTLKLNAQTLIKNDVKFSKTLIKVDSSLQFIAMGDWGRNGADHQKQVAVQMGKTAAEVKAQFVVATGDNFYPSGVISEQDPLFKYSFEDIYTAFPLQVDWYPILGNHDYKSNPDAQVAYTKISRRWKMPSRYYSKTVAINGDRNNQVLLVFMDTNPLIAEYYKNEEYGPNVKGQDTVAQKKWLEKLLSNSSPSIKWKIVVAHHPMYTGGSRTNGYDTKAIRNSLKSILDKYKVDVYLTGHEHSLQHLKPAGPTHHFITGSASEKTPAKLIDESEMAASEYGFMLFSITKNQLRVQTINDSGEVIYTTLLTKPN